MPQNPEYISSVTLVVVGENLDPDLLNTMLDLAPDQSWRKGDIGKFGKTYEWGGWKKAIPEELKNAGLEEQLLYWISKLIPLKQPIEKLWEMGCQAALDCFVKLYDKEKENASITMNPELFEFLKDVKVELKISFKA